MNITPRYVGLAARPSTKTKYGVLKRSTGGHRSLMATGEAENSTLERSECALEGLLFFIAKVRINIDATAQRDNFCSLRLRAGSMGSMGVVQGRYAL
jgi:hypothetical protein